MGRSEVKEAFDKQLRDNELVSRLHTMETAVNRASFTFTELGNRLEQIAEGMRKLSDHYTREIEIYKEEKNQRS